jgi:hypothetical protein
VTGPPADPTGFCIIKGDELYQLFVAAHARGSGAAVALIDDGEMRLSKGGRYGLAWPVLPGTPGGEIPKTHGAAWDDDQPGGDWKDRFR